MHFTLYKLLWGGGQGFGAVIVPIGFFGDVVFAQFAVGRGGRVF